MPQPGPGAGPLVGPVLAAQMGYLPGTIWIIARVIFAGAVQDMVTLFFSMRRNARTRVGRFMLQDTLGNVYRPLRRTSWLPGVWVTSAAVVAAWGYFLYTGATNPLGGINQLYPLFGTANQLLAGVALAVATTLLVKSGRLKWAWVTGVPLAWDVAVTFTASWQKVFSGDPKLGFFTQRARYQDAIDAGKLLPPAKNMNDMHAIVTNSTVDGILAALFALLVLVVLLDALRTCVRAVRATEPLPTTEVPFAESHLVAPAGLIATPEERRRTVRAAPADHAPRHRHGHRPAA